MTLSAVVFCCSRSVAAFLCVVCSFAGGQGSAAQANEALPELSDVLLLTSSPWSDFESIMHRVAAPRHRMIE